MLEYLKITKFYKILSSSNCNFYDFCFYFNLMNENGNDSFNEQKTTYWLMNGSFQLYIKLRLKRFSNKQI